MQMVTKTKKMFIGGLSATSTVEDITGYFEQYGVVSVHYKLWNFLKQIAVKSKVSTLVYTLDRAFNKKFNL